MGMNSETIRNDSLVQGVISWIGFGEGKFEDTPRGLLFRCPHLGAQLRGKRQAEWRSRNDIVIDEASPDGVIFLGLTLVGLRALVEQAKAEEDNQKSAIWNAAKDEVNTLLERVQTLQQQVGAEPLTRRELEKRFDDLENCRNVEEAKAFLQAALGSLETAETLTAEVAHLRTLFPHIEISARGMQGEGFFVGYTRREIETLIAQPELANNLAQQNDALEEEIVQLLAKLGIERDGEDALWFVASDTGLQERFLAHFGFEMGRVHVQTRDDWPQNVKTLTVYSTGGYHETRWESMETYLFLWDFLEKVKTFA